MLIHGASFKSNRLLRSLGRPIKDVLGLLVFPLKVQKSLRISLFIVSYICHKKCMTNRSSTSKYLANESLRLNNKELQYATEGL